MPQRRKRKSFCQSSSGAGAAIFASIAVKTARTGTLGAHARLGRARPKPGAGSWPPVNRTVTPPICPYCGNPAEFFETSHEFYRCYADLGPMWACRRCQAWTGCHKGTKIPLGSLANWILRGARIEAHKAFDPLWEAKVKRGMPKHEARARGYRWLAEQLGIPASECHIGKMDEQTCKRVRQICAPYKRNLVS